MLGYMEIERRCRVIKEARVIFIHRSSCLLATSSDKNVKCHLNVRTTAVRGKETAGCEARHHADLCSASFGSIILR